MKIIIRVYDKADNLELDLTEDTTIQQIKVLAAEKLKLEKEKEIQSFTDKNKIRKTFERYGYYF